MPEATVAEFDVFCQGSLEVLSIGKGDLKIVISGPEDVDNARRIIEEMLRKGYSIYVDTDRGPTRVKRFNPKRFTYTIVEVPEGPAAAVAPSRPQRGRKATSRASEREVGVAGSRATAVGRTAGG